METKKQSRTQPKSAATPPPWSMALRSSQQASRTCLAILESLLHKHPKAKATIEAVRLHEGRVVEFVVSVQPPARANWEKPTPALIAAFEFTQDLSGTMYEFSPMFAPRPDAEDRASAQKFVTERLAPVFHQKIA